MKRFVWLGLALGAVACGDDGGSTPIDAATIDAVAIDAPDIDAPPAVFAGSITLLEAAVLNPGTSGTFFGQGPQVGITFFDPATAPAPLMEEMPGSPIGCKVWEYTPAQAAAASVGVDEGPVAITLTGGQAQHNLPPCGFQAGAGYACPHTNTQGTGGTIAAGPQTGLATLTTTVAYSANNSTGKYVKIAGATNGANNGVFPIVAVGGANTIVYANPAFVAETTPATSTHINLAGVGPIPSAPDPGFLDNANAASIVHTMGGGNHVATFTSTTGVGTIGDDFVLNADTTMNTAETIKLNAIPRTGAAFTITCDAASCPGGSASGMLLNIVTTDGVLGASPFGMPLPATKRVQVRCAVLQGGTANGATITVPAAYMARIQAAPVTRIQATLIRAALMGGGPSEVSTISGHAIVGFTNAAN